MLRRLCRHSTFPPKSPNTLPTTHQPQPQVLLAQLLLCVPPLPYLPPSPLPPNHPPTMTIDVVGAALVLCVGGPAGGCAARAVRLPRRGGASDDAVGRAVARAAGRSGGGRGVAMCHAAGKVGWGGGQTEVRRRCVTLKVWWGKEEGVGRRGGRGAAMCRASGMVGMGEAVVVWGE